MNSCFFVSDLHGKMSRYEALFKMIRKEKPDFVFLGGDLLPHTSRSSVTTERESNSFVKDFLIRKFSALKDKMDCAYPEVFLIPGNDDQKLVFEGVAEGEKAELWRNLHNHCIVIGKYRFYGYAFVPPTPFMVKDWDKFDIYKEVEKGCIAPADGFHSLPPEHDLQNDTIQLDLQRLIKDDEMQFSIFLFHSPPHSTFLDQAAFYAGNLVQGLAYVSAGSKAIREFIEHKQPYITLHGHIHESARISGQWKQSIRRTLCMSAAHDGPELSLVTFELQDPLNSNRRLIKT
jgi:uncharacterized protein